MGLSASLQSTVPSVVITKSPRDARKRVRGRVVKQKIKYYVQVIAHRYYMGKWPKNSAPRRG